MQDSAFRIVTYNLQKCIGMDLRRRPDRSMQVLDSSGASVAVLQEADKRVAPRHPALPHAIVEEFGWHIVPVQDSGVSLGWHGNAMLVRHGVEVIETGRIPLPGLEPRGAIRADLMTPLGPLRVVGMHLGLLKRNRLQQMRAVSRALFKLPAMPMIWAGDLNEWRDGHSLNRMARGVTLQPGVPSYPAPRPVGMLDRFAVSAELKVLDTAAHLAAPARVASDHLPVWIDLGLATSR